MFQSDFLKIKTREHTNVLEYINMSYLLLIVNILCSKKKMIKKKCFQKKIEFKFKSKSPKISLNLNKISRKSLII